MITPSAFVKLAKTWINNGSRFGPSETLRGLRKARRTRRRPVRRTRYASGITRWTVRSIFSAIDETSSVILILGCQCYAKARTGAMQCAADQSRALSEIIVSIIRLGERKLQHVLSADWKPARRDRRGCLPYKTWSHLLWSLSIISRSRRMGGMPWLSSSLWNFLKEQ